MVLIKQEELFKIRLLNNESIRWLYTQGVKLHLNNIKSKPNRCWERMGKLTNHPKISSIQKYGKNKDTKQKKIQWYMLQRTVFINKIRLQQWTQMLQRTQRNAIGWRVHEMSGLPSLITASAINFVIAWKVQLSV